jgi:hypothetical protein
MSGESGTDVSTNTIASWEPFQLKLSQPLMIKYKTD